MPRSFADVSVADKSLPPCVGISAPNTPASYDQRLIIPRPHILPPNIDIRLLLPHQEYSKASKGAGLYESGTTIHHSLQRRPPFGWLDNVFMLTISREQPHCMLRMGENTITYGAPAHLQYCGILVPISYNIQVTKVRLSRHPQSVCALMYNYSCPLSKNENMRTRLYKPQRCSLTLGSTPFLNSYVFIQLAGYY